MNGKLILSLLLILAGGGGIVAWILIENGMKRKGTFPTQKKPTEMEMVITRKPVLFVFGIAAVFILEVITGVTKRIYLSGTGYSSQIGVASSGFRFMFGPFVTAVLVSLLIAMMIGGLATMLAVYIYTKVKN